MPIATLAEWSAFFASHPEAHILQSDGWGELKSHFGWEPIRFINGENGAQLLIRRLPLGQKMAYLPMGPVGNDWSSLREKSINIAFKLGLLFSRLNQMRVLICWISKSGGRDASQARK